MPDELLHIPVKIARGLDLEVVEAEALLDGLGIEGGALLPLPDSLEAVAGVAAPGAAAQDVGGLDRGAGVGGQRQVDRFPQARGPQFQLLLAGLLLVDR